MPQKETIDVPGSSWVDAPFAALYRTVIRLLDGRPARDAALLAVRLIGARAMSVLTLIVAAWLVNIEAFGAFGVYQTLATLAWIALFLRYDAAVVAAKNEDEYEEALRLCIVIGAALWLIFTGLAFLAGLLNVVKMQLALLLPLSILARGILRLSFVVTTRVGDFKDLGRSSLVQALLQPTILIVLVLSPVDDLLCFVIADIAGHLGAGLFLAWRRRHRLQSLGHGWSRSALVDAALRWKNLPLYNLPGSFLAIAFGMSPLLIIPMVADELFAGHVALAYRIFDVPTQIITAASTPIFLNRLRPSTDQANPIFGRSIMLGLVALLGLAYAAMAGLLMVLDPLLDQTSLAALSEAVPYVASFQIFIALAAPIGDSCALYPQQRRLVLIQGLAVAGGLLTAVMADGMAPTVILTALAVLAGLRALALGELLRKLSNLSHHSFSRRPSGSNVPTHEGIEVEGD